MRIIKDGLKFCSDCAVAAVNDDYTGLSARYGEDDAAALQVRIERGLAGFGLHLVHVEEDEGEGWYDCACCGAKRCFGRAELFAILG